MSRGIAPGRSVPSLEGAFADTLVAGTVPGRNRGRAQIPVGVAIEGQESQQRQVAPTVVVAVE